jgi:amino acid transporter
MAQLQRSLSLPLITFYGLGTILGAGIYVLLGAVSGAAGYFLPLSFLCAAVIAGFTAFSYAELVARLPRSGGEAVYVDAAFHQRWLTVAVGYSAVAVGTISAATIASGFAGYLRLFVALDPRLVITTVVLALGTVAAIGIRASAWAATVMTLIEIGGLVIIIYLAGDRLADWDALDYQRLVPREFGDWRGIGVGAFLAFYAFLGFEDMVNVAEEVRDPSRNLPRAIVAALVISTVLYLLVGLAAIASVPIETLSASTAPLATIAGAEGLSPRFMGLIALVAITNGALIQMIKSSRILYGMANLGDAPLLFGRVSPWTNTPLFATIVVAALVLSLALWLSTIDLAVLTSLVTLCIFAAVNAALWKLKRAAVHPPGIVRYPVWVPIIGFVLCLLLLAVQIL